MTAWMITIDTPQGVAPDADVLVSFSDALDDARGVTGAAASVDVETGVLRSLYRRRARPSRRGGERSFRPG